MDSGEESWRDRRNLRVAERGISRGTARWRYKRQRLVSVEIEMQLLSRSINAVLPYAHPVNFELAFDDFCLNLNPKLFDLHKHLAFPWP